MKISVKTIGISLGILIAVSLILGIFVPMLNAFRIVFGSVFVLFLPGFVITSLFFENIDWIEKIAFGFALSIAIVPLAVFYLNKLGVKINTLNSILTIVGVISVAFLVKWIMIKRNKVHVTSAKI